MITWKKQIKGEQYIYVQSDVKSADFEMFHQVEYGGDFMEYDTILHGYSQ
jgi:hypothetical protein